MLLGSYPFGVVITAFLIGGLLAFGSLWYHSTRTGIIYRDELILLPIWTVAVTLVLLVYQQTALWPGLLVLLQLGAMLFAYWSYTRKVRLQKQ